tara:strand:- start:373 stop:570 length:198 start_codon:yes stop_codon:yes gene_type:complete
MEKLPDSFEDYLRQMIRNTDSSGELWDAYGITDLDAASGFHDTIMGLKTYAERHHGFKMEAENVK